MHRQLIDHGIEHEQYFQGCGLGDYDHVATGIGNDASEALDDALEQLASSGIDVSLLDIDPTELGDASVSKMMAGSYADHSDYDDHHYYVSIRVR